MGRRKIEIKAIKDDRNRSVTFLKRKGGLFKKAHELSVLCSVDVAVIIFGNNKKLYEYSSSDIGEILQRHNFYGGANEHKGPADFNGKRDDNDEEEDGSIPEGSAEPQTIMAPQVANQAAYQHMRQGPSHSPPIPSGAQFQHVQRQLTPQPLMMGSRPSSRNAPRMVNSNMGPQHIQRPQPSPPVNGFTYMQHQHPPMYAQQGMPPHSQAPPNPSFQYTGPPPQQHQLQQVYMEEQRGASMPPTFPQHERQNSGSINTPPLSQHQLPSQQHQQQHQQQAVAQMHQQQQVQMHQQHQIQQQQEQQRQQQEAHRRQQETRQQAQVQAQVPQMQAPPPQPQPQPAPQAQMLEPVKRLSVKSRSIFTPIDESRSILSQHWVSSTNAETRPEAHRTVSGSSVGSGSGDRANSVATTNPAAMKSPPKPGPKRNVSVGGPPPVPNFGPPSRTNSGLGGAAGAKRPRLKVQIPDEASGSENTGSANASPSQGTSNDATNGVSQAPRQGGVVLPPPSPSTNSILSAGATGPPNPFARPHPPQQNPSRESIGSRDSNAGRDRDRDNIETPVSALPSRFMNNEFLPSPSTFYPEWNLGLGMGGFRSGMGELQSPLNFATPVAGTGPSFARDEISSRDGNLSRDGFKPELHRTGSSGSNAGSGVTKLENANPNAKRKSPEEEGGDEKRLKVES